MRAVLQRVSSASVSINGGEPVAINQGLVVLVGFCPEDTPEEIDYFIDKIVNLRIFSDENDQMNLSLLDVGGELLVVSNFTLYANSRRGRRPSFSEAAAPQLATTLYETFLEGLSSQGCRMVSGEFGADMQVELTNDGPVTIWLDSQELCPRKE